MKEAHINTNGIIKMKREDIGSPSLAAIRDDFCVYLIECENEIVYIGQSENIVYRMMQHKYNLHFDYVYIGVMEDNSSYRDMLFMESYLIGIAEPIFNFSNFTRKTFKNKDFHYVKEHIEYIGA